MSTWDTVPTAANTCPLPGIFSGLRLPHQKEEAMAVARIYLGDAPLSSKQKTALETKFDKKTLVFEYTLSETNLDGDFSDKTAWNAFLWDKINKEIGFPQPVVKAKKVTSTIDAPGGYPVEIEVNGFGFKGKVSIKQKAGDKTVPNIKKNSHPAHVTVKVNGAKKSDLANAYLDELDELVKEMKKTTSYSYVGGSGSNKGWSPDFGKHLVHEQPGKGWKAYIDISRGTGTMWRLYFEVDFDVKTQTLLV
jgi:hypothetical protein